MSFSTRLKFHRCENASKKRISELNQILVGSESSTDILASHFALAMQSGAFVQVIILFIAISSRMSMLSSQLEETLQLSISTCNRLLGIIDVCLQLMGEHALTDSQPTDTPVTVPQQPPLKPETLPLSYIDHDIPSEDTGQSVSRCEPIGTSAFVVEDLGLKAGATLEMRVTAPPSQPTEGMDNGV